MQILCNVIFWGPVGDIDFSSHVLDSADLTDACNNLFTSVAYRGTVTTQPNNSYNYKLQLLKGIFGVVCIVKSMLAHQLKCSKLLHSIDYVYSIKHTEDDVHVRFPPP